MSSTSKGMEMETEFPDEPAAAGFRLYKLETSEGKQCSLLQAPTVLEGLGSNPSDTFNILMADVSSSMCSFWSHVVEGWTTYIENKLSGVTKLFVFNQTVTFLRDGTTLLSEDNQGGCTNITKALRTVKDEVEKCTQSFIQVFIITDGGHSSGSPLPEDVIQEMRSPPGKTVNVYLLGISSSFPVNYSIDIRSRLHSGSANLPPLYWAKHSEEIVEQMAEIGSDMGSHVKMVLNQEGFKLPGLPGTQLIHRGEWLYIPKAPEELVGLKVSINDEEERKIPIATLETTIYTLLDHVFPQWNSVLIQQHRKKEQVPKEVFGLMDSLFKMNMEKVQKASSDLHTTIKERLMNKEERTLEMRYKTMMNMSRTVIEVEGKYMDEIELANNILKSTVSGGKYDTKVLKIRGRGLDDYDKDKEEFFNIYKKQEELIRALPQPQPEDCCRITMSSTLSDLQDQDFPLLKDEDKFTMMKTFTMSGIPAYAPIRDATKINSWTLSIRQILVTPFTVLSQRAIEAFAEMEGADKLGSANKDVKLKADDDTSRFNIVIPIVPAYAAAALKPLVRSNLYAMLTTFSILKDPHIIDYSAHLAALGCAWVKSIAEHPPPSRPGYITDRLASIVATTELYMDRKSITHYLEVLGNTPNKALMTEATDPTNNQTVKCESLVKPLFLLGMRKDKFTTPQLTAILGLLLAEFVGRCLSKYKDAEANATPFSDFFAAELSESAKREEWLTKQSQSLIEEFNSSCGDLLKKFYAPETVKKAFDNFVKGKSATLGDRLINNITLTLNMEKVKHLKYIASCGDVTFHTFKAWAQEMGVPEENILAAYDPSQLTVNVCEALSFRSSKERLDRKQRSYSECMEHIRSQVTKENEKALLENLKMKESEVVGQWKTQYMKVHESLVLPLTLQQVVSQAQTHKIDVTEETFSQVYRYDAKTGLLRNACQIPGCPYYLFPSSKFNQHLAVERAAGKFPHSLHKVSRELNSESVDKVLDLVISGEHSGQNGRKKQVISETLSLQKLKSDIEELLKVYSGLSALN